MAYQRLDFPIPTPTQLGALLSNARVGQTIMVQRPSTTNPAFVEQGPDQWLNIYTGEIVDAETMDAVSSMAQSNPSILTAPAASLPATLRSSAVENQIQSGGVPTAASAGIGPAAAPSGFMAWFQKSILIGGTSIPNWALAGGGGLLAFLFLGGKSGRRR